MGCELKSRPDHLTPGSECFANKKSYQISDARGYTRAFDDGPRNFELCPNDVDDTRAGNPTPNYHTTPTGGRFSSQQI
ncbi:hypothetical protein TNCV_2300771 [Trichonephila clavipes]|nr:hypothetical protein TNCV_2300771 [Trichonephila clavipes]